MSIEVHFPQYLASIHRCLDTLLYPIERTVDMPFHLKDNMGVFWQDRNALSAENEQLKHQQIYLQARIQKLESLEAENLELQALLNAAGNDIESYSAARLIHVETDPFRQQVLLNKGSEDSVQEGQPVIEPSGLVGVVLSTQAHTSRVLLLSDTTFAVPVQSVRSKERAIAMGGGVGGEMQLSYVPRTADFVEGDMLVTSGVGGGFPQGYPVGVITSIQHDPGTRFSIISLRPHVKLGQFRHVLLVKHFNRNLLEKMASESTQTKPKHLEASAKVGAG